MQVAPLIGNRRHYTYADYIAIDDDKRYEVLEGDIMMVPAPSTLHQRLSWEIGFVIGRFVKENNLGYIFDAPTDVVFAEDVVTQPDILFIGKERASIIEKNAIMGAPDLVVEILSPSSTFNDVVKKRGLYQRYGVKEYWVVFPEEKAIEVATLEDGVYRDFSSAKDEGSVKSKVLKGLKVELKDVFIS